MLHRAGSHHDIFRNQNYAEIRFLAGIVRIARDWKLRVQNLVILMGSVLLEELVFCKQTSKLTADFVRSGFQCKQCVQLPVSVQLSYVYRYKVILIQYAP